MKTHASKNNWSNLLLVFWSDDLEILVFICLEKFSMEMFRVLLKQRFAFNGTKMYIEFHIVTI